MVQVTAAADSGDGSNTGQVARAEGLLTVSEVAAWLCVHPNTVRSWSDKGLVRTHRVGRRGDRRFRREDLETIVQYQRLGEGVHPQEEDLRRPSE